MGGIVILSLPFYLASRDIGRADPVPKWRDIISGENGSSSPACPGDHLLHPRI
jgi:hypothetical protein